MDTIPPGLEGLLETDPEVVGGLACFKDTRIPLDTILDSFAAGETVDSLLEGFPSLEREQIEQVRDWSREIIRKASGY